MTKTRETQQPNLETMIRRLPEEPMAGDLVKRIVARTISLPQQLRPEEQVAVVPDAPTKERISLQSSRWFKPSMAAALAASLIVLFLNVPDGRMQPSPPALVQALPSKMKAEPTYSKGPRGTAQVVEVTQPRPAPMHEPNKRHTDAANLTAPSGTLMGSPEIRGATESVPETAPTHLQKQEGVEEMVVIMPLGRPVQGPPVPDEPRYGYNGSGIVTGLGVAGKTSPPISSSLSGSHPHPPPPPR